MSQDLREVFKKEREAQKARMKEGHSQRFLERLEDELPQERKSKRYLLKIAATVLLVIAASYFAFQKFSSEVPDNTSVVDDTNRVEEQKGISLGDLSPDLKKVENYYVANINLELSRLAISEDNKALVDSYMEQLENLDIEYKRLNKELNEIGPNDQTISALIQNLQLRLQLLQKLKKKLNDLKTSKNEQVETNII